MFILIATLPSLSFAKEINMCIDPRFAQQEALTIYTKMMIEATKRAGHTLKVFPTNWEDCQEKVKKNVFEGAIPASYNDERASYMQYPADANTNSDSTQALVKINYVAVTPVDKKYEFNGNFKSIPQPILIPEGYSVIKDLQKKESSLNVDERGNSDRKNIRTMLMKNEGSVVMMASQARQLLESPLLKNRIAISKYILSKTYYMPFSKNSTLTPEQINQIWQQFALIWKDTEWMKTHQPIEKDE